jgi:signal transduction histidine kinase
VDERRQCAFEARFQHANGRTIWVLAHVAAEGDGQGAVAGYVGAITDMTELRRLEREVLEISEREQQRIGQDLHDDLCQQLVAIQYSAASVKRDLKARGDSTAVMAGEVVDLLKGTLLSTRQMARRIFPVNLDQAGLMSALQELATNSSRFFDIECRFECPEPILVEDNATGAHLYRIAQEALSNAVRHGQAKEVIISLTHEPHQLGLTISDNGIGLKPAAAAESTGMGLHIMHYRSRMIGATLRVESLPEGGTRVRCTLPRHGSQLREMAKAAETEIPTYES